MPSGEGIWSSLFHTKGQRQDNEVSRDIWIINVCLSSHTVCGTKSYDSYWLKAVQCQSKSSMGIITWHLHLAWIYSDFSENKERKTWFNVVLKQYPGAFERPCEGKFWQVAWAKKSRQHSNKRATNDNHCLKKSQQRNLSWEAQEILKFQQVMPGVLVGPHFVPAWGICHFIFKKNPIPKCQPRGRGTAQLKLTNPLSV